MKRAKKKPFILVNPNRENAGVVLTSGDIPNPNGVKLLDSPYWKETMEASLQYGMPSRDHQSTLLYLQWVQANHGGDVWQHNNGQHMRYKARSQSRMGSAMAWEGKWGTKYWDGTIGADHDDFDCLRDLEVLGLLKDHGTGAFPLVALTAKGHEACGKLIDIRSKYQQAEKVKP